jgi:NAD(P)H dehydrogenase (quinone)
MLMVTGATGQLGRGVVSHLRRSNLEGDFTILARDAAKAARFVDVPVRLADFDDPASLPPAFAGVSTLLLISTMSMNRAHQQRQVVDAAVAAGVEHIVYTGLAIRDIASSGVRDIMSSHFETEDHITASGVGYTFLRNTMYAEAIRDIVSPALRDGSFSLPGGAGRVPYVLRAELAEAAANVLIDGGHENRTYTLTADRSWSYAEVASALSELVSSPVEYRDVSADEFTSMLAGTGMPEFARHLTAGTVADIKDGQYEVVSSDLTALLGRRPRGLPAMLSELYQGALAESGV